MTEGLLGDGMHPGCGDPVQLPSAVPPEDLGPCAICGQITMRYGDTAASTLCDNCRDVAS